MIQRYFLLVMVGAFAGLAGQWWLLALSIAAALYFYRLGRKVPQPGRLSQTG